MGEGPASRGARSALPRRIYSTLYGTVMLSGIGTTVILSALPTLGRAADIPDVFIGGVFALSAAAWAITSPLWGRYSDRHGRRPLLLIGLAGGAISMFLFGLVTFAGVRHWAAPALIFVGFLISRGLNGLLASAATSGAQAYVADHTGAAARTKALAGLASALGLGTLIGPTLIPVLGLAGVGVEWAMMLVGTANLALLALVPVLIDTDQDRTGLTGATAGAVHWRRREIRPFLAYGFVMLSAQAVNAAVLGFTLIDRSGGDLAVDQKLLSGALLGGAVATLAAQLILIPLFKPRAGQLLLVTPVALIAGNLVLWASTGVVGAMVGFVVASFGYGLGRPAFASGASLAVGPAEQGAVAGLTSGLTGLCSVAAPVLAVLAYGRTPGAPYLANLAAGGMLLILALGSARLRRSGQDVDARPLGVEAEVT